MLQEQGMQLQEGAFVQLLAQGRTGSTVTRGRTLWMCACAAWFSQSEGLPGRTGWVCG
jgi:hypothetical protein